MTAHLTSRITLAVLLFFLVATTAFVLQRQVHPGVRAAGPVPTPTTTPTATPSLVALSPVEDAYVSSSRPDDNFGSTADLRSDASPLLESFLTFDLQPFAGQSVSSATLRMFVTNRSNGLQSVKDITDTSWSEGSLTFNTRPAKGATIASFTPSTSQSWIEVDITSAAAGSVGSLMSISIESPSRDGYRFNAKEAATNQVELLIEVSGPTATPTATPTITPTPSGTPATATPAPQLVALAPVEDAYVSAGGPDANFGSSADLRSDASPLLESFLTFDLRPFAAQNVSLATLRMFVTNRSNGLQSVKNVVDTSWSEATLTYNSRPATGATIATFTPRTSQTWIEVDVTSAVAGNNGSLMSIAIDSLSSDGYRFNAKEASTNQVELLLQVTGPTATPTATAAQTLTPTPTSTPTPTATGTITPTPTATLTGTPSPTATATGIPTDTATPTATGAPTSTSTSTPTPAATPTDETLTFLPSDDAYIQQDSPSANFGSANTVEVDNSPLKNFLLRFPVSGVGSRHVLSARVRLFVTNQSGSGGDFHEVLNSTWSEGTITWNTAPAAEPGVVASLGAVSVGEWVEVDVTSVVSGDGAVSVRVTSNTSDGADYSSKEGANPPMLAVDVSDTPPPPTPTASPTPTAMPSPTPGGTGFRDFSYSPVSAPTGDKPQSKLWFNDGLWWGSLFNRSTGGYDIYRLDLATQTWSTTGVEIDSRNNAKADVLWDGTKLYTVTARKSATQSGDSAEVRRFSYNPGTQTYSLDSGFPVTVSNGGAEVFLIEKDTAGTLWVTYTQGNKVRITHTTSSDTAWVAPFTLPVAGASTLTSDDISAIQAFDAKIGIMWSNQNDDTMYFAVHNDGDADGVWSVEDAVAGSELADDHINLKTAGGRVYAATKTSLNGASDPLILLNVREPDGTWSQTVFGTVANNHTRPIVLIDEQHGTLYMFAASPCCSGAVIYLKQTSLANPSFPPGLGVPFITLPTDPKINNVSSTKQNLSSATGLVVIAGDDSTRFYLHNWIPLP